jgi:hypothetical protein
MPMIDRFERLYQEPERLSVAFAHERIFAPPAYPLVRRLQVAPLVHIEALAMAAWFPVCWRSGPGLPELVALRSLAEDAEVGQPPGSPRQPASLPMALRAYPVAVTRQLGDGGAIIVERAVADAPGDQGAPLAMPDGKPSRALAQRYRTALVARHAAAATDAMTAALHEADAFRPWPLRFPLAGGFLEVEGMLHAPAEAIPVQKGKELLARFGVDLSVLLTAHRISLFRIADLLGAAEKAARADAAA